MFLVLIKIYIFFSFKLFNLFKFIILDGKSGGNYSKNGGYSNFSWKKVEGLEGYSIIDVDFDNKGNVFALASSKYR